MKRALHPALIAAALLLGLPQAVRAQAIGQMFETERPDAPPPAFEEPTGRRSNNPYAALPASYPADAMQVSGFTGPDQWIIRRYFDLARENQLRSRATKKTLPRALPAGITAAVKAGDQINPNFERIALPRPLERDLPKTPRGLQRVIIGNDVALVRFDGRVLDVIPGALH